MTNHQYGWREFSEEKEACRTTERRRKRVLIKLTVVLSALVIELVLGLVTSPLTLYAVSSGTNGKIAFDTNRDDNEDIYVMNFDGSDPTRLTNNLASDHGAAWSPDGMKISFHSNRDGNFEIYVMNADGSGQTRLTNNVAQDNQSTWSPDGSKIAFKSFRDDNAEIYVMKSDGTGQTNLSNNLAFDDNPTWSPDGTQIAFTSNRDGNLEIYVMNADGTGQTNLSNNAANDDRANWSPDGLKIAFISDRDSNSEIYVMNADGTGQANLSNNAAFDDKPVWSPDGTKIVFRSVRDENSEIYVMNADGTGQTNLSNNAAEDVRPDWQPIPADPLCATIVTSTQREYQPHLVSSAVSNGIATFVADLDGDSDMDLISSSRNIPTELNWYQNDGEQSFQSQRLGGLDMYDVDVGDTDNDGDMDIVAVAGGSNTTGVWFYEGNGSGGFTERKLTSYSRESARDVKIADINADGWKDIVVNATHSYWGYVTILAGQGGNVFSRLDLTSSFVGPQDLDIADIDGDSDLDIVVLGSGGGVNTTAPFAWWRNDGELSFTRVDIPHTIVSGKTVLARDFDADGDTDIFAHFTFEGAYLWRNDGGEHFIRETVSSKLDNSRLFAVDIDADGDFDMVEAAEDSGDIYILNNDGSGNFSEELVAHTDPGVFGPSARDIDADGDIDILTVGKYTGELIWWENTIVNSPPCLQEPLPSQEVDEGGETTLFVEANDPDGDPLTYAWDLDNNGSFETPEQNPIFSALGRDGPGSQVVVVQVCDDEDACDTADTTVAITNAPPAITAVDNDGPIDEGTVTTIFVTASDPAGVDDPLSYQFDCDGDGNYEIGPQPVPSITCDFDDNGDFTVNVRVTDDDDGGATGATTVTVNNVAPRATLAGDDIVNEGDTRKYSYAVSDPGADTFTLNIESCGTGGTLSNSAFDESTGAGSFDCTFPDGPASTEVSVAVSDDDGGNGGDSLAVVVNNVAPSVTLTGDDTVNEGDTRKYSYAVSDPGADTFTLNIESCGTGGTLSNSAFNESTGAGSFDCTFPDGPASTEVSVAVSDDDGGNGGDSLAVVVNNVAPSVTLTGDDTVNEGDTRKYSYAVSDPGADTFTLNIESCGTGGTLSNSAFDESTGAGSFDCTFPDGPASTEVSVAVSDDDGGNGGDSLVVTINNVAPSSIELSLDRMEIDENDSVILSSSFADPGALDEHTVAIDWGDGASETLTLPVGERSFSALHLYLDDDPTDTPADVLPITVSIADDDGNSESAGTAVTVNNVAPNVGDITIAVPVIEKGGIVNTSAEFSDLGTADTHLAVWDWGDGTQCDTDVDADCWVDEPSDTAPGSVYGSHTYVEPGVHTVNLSVIDDDTGTDGSVYQFVVVYDPEGGFVTGGGWIDSPPGACQYADCTDDTVGKANFGFVSKYKKGANQPTGTTEFQFRAGNLNFHSNSYDWLVVAGHKAQYKGTGTINGTGNYGFMISAIDEQLTPSTDVDLFRIKIWDKDNGDAIVYDNQMGDTDDADATTAIGGGNIVIHTGKGGKGKE